MEFYVYILFSCQHNKSYVGMTSSLEQRLHLYNHSDNKLSYTAKFRPWVIAYYETFNTKSEALKREKLFKTGIGRECKVSILNDFISNNLKAVPRRGEPPHTTKPHHIRALLLPLFTSNHTYFHIDIFW